MLSKKTKAERDKNYDNQKEYAFRKRIRKRRAKNKVARKSRKYNRGK